MSYIEDDLLPFLRVMEEKLDKEGQAQKDQGKQWMQAGMLTAIEMTREMIEADRDLWEDCHIKAEDL